MNASSQSAGPRVTPSTITALELGQPCAHQGGYPYRRHLPLLGRDARDARAQVGLVAHHDSCGSVAGTVQQRPGRIGSRVPIVDDHENQIRIVDCASGALDADPFHRIRRLPESGGIVNVERYSRDQDPFAHHIASRAGNVGDDSGLGTRQPVEKTGFPYIRLARDHELHTVAQNRAAVRPGKRRVDSGAQRLESCRSPGPSEELDSLFVGKVNRRFDVGPQLDQRIEMTTDRARELPGERAARATRSRGGRTVDDVRDRLGLRQVDTVVEKRPKGELAGPRDPSPELADAVRAPCAKPPRHRGPEAPERLRR